jgi:hypothetical protein
MLLLKFSEHVHDCHCCPNSSVFDFLFLSNLLVLGFLRFCQICHLYSLIRVLYPNPIQVDLNCKSLVIMKLLFKGF